MIADETHAALARGERRHAVVRARRRLPVVEEITRPSEAQILEAFRQHQQWQSSGLVLGGEQRTVAGGVTAPDAALVILRAGRALDKSREWDRGAGRYGRPLQK